MYNNTPIRSDNYIPWLFQTNVKIVTSHDKKVQLHCT